MPEHISFGVYSMDFDGAGHTVPHARKLVDAMWSIPSDAVTLVNGKLPPKDYLIQRGDQLSITHHRSRTVCAECDKPTYTEIEGYPLCYDHYQHTVSHCTEHHWMLDSTEVFQEHGQPVFRAFYFCTICARAVVAKAGESADQAWMNRQRERLLRIEKLLTEET